MPMRTKTAGLAALAGIAVSASIAAFVLLLFRIPQYSIRAHAFRPGAVSFLAFWALAAALLAGLAATESSLLARIFRISIKEAFGRIFPTFLPLVILSFAPLALRHYIGRPDLLERLEILALAAAGAVLYLQVSAVRKMKGETAGRGSAPPLRPAGIRPHGKLTFLFFASLVAFNAGSALLAGRGVTFSGDEPHYLLMAHSLLHDGDLNLANNYERKDYRAYMQVPAALDPHVVPGKKAGSQYSFHSPGTAFLLLPFYALGSLFGKTGLILIARFGMSLAGALFSLQLFLLARRILEDEKAASLLWALTSLATPVFFYSIHVYPELIAGLFALTAFRFLAESDRLTRGRIVAAGLLLSGLIWLHALKYIFLLGPLFLYGLWVLKKNRKKVGDFAAFILPAGILLAFYFGFQYSLYGSFSLSAVSWKGSLGGGETLSYIKSLFADIPFRFRLETLAGYFLDQKDGLLFYAPVYIFAFLGVVEMVRRKSAVLIPLILVTVPYVFVSAFLTQRTGYAPQARPLMAVIWGLAIPLGVFIVNRGKDVFSKLFAWAGGAGILVTWLLLRNPFNLYQETTVGSTERGGGLFYLLSNLHFRLTDWLPSYIKSAEGPWWPNYVWPGILVIFIAAYCLVPKKDFIMKPAVRTAAACMLTSLVFIWLALFPRQVLFSPLNVGFPSGEKITFYSLSRVARQIAPGRFLLPQDNRAYIFTFQSRQKLDRLDFEFGSPDGDYAVSLEYYDQLLFEGTTRRASKSLEISDPTPYDFKGTSLYWVTFRLERKSEVKTEEHPYLFALRPVSR